jgi:hypothetical protein
VLFLLLVSFALAGSLCNDGWSSPSEGRGTCSHHGGVRKPSAYESHYSPPRQPIAEPVGTAWPARPDLLVSRDVIGPYDTFQTPSIWMSDKEPGPGYAGAVGFFSEASTTFMVFAEQDTCNTYVFIHYSEKKVASALGWTLKDVDIRPDVKVYSGDFVWTVFGDLKQTVTVREGTNGLIYYDLTFGFRPGSDLYNAVRNGHKLRVSSGSSTWDSINLTGSAKAIDWLMKMCKA